MDLPDLMTWNIIALDSGYKRLFRMTIMSSRSFEESLQRAIAIGQRMVRNEREIVRVEIYQEPTSSHMSAKPHAVVTSDDLPLSLPQPPAIKRSLLWGWVRKLLGRDTIQGARDHCNRMNLVEDPPCHDTEETSIQDL